MLQAVTAVLIALIIGAPILWSITVNGIDVSGLGEFTAAGVSLGSRMYGAVAPHTVLAPIGTFFVLVFLGVLYPGLKAARLQPIDAMRHS